MGPSARSDSPGDQRPRTRERNPGVALSLRHCFNTDEGQPHTQGLFHWRVKQFCSLTSERPLAAPGGLPVDVRAELTACWQALRERVIGPTAPMLEGPPPLPTLPGLWARYRGPCIRGTENEVSAGKEGWRERGRAAGKNADLPRLREAWWARLPQPRWMAAPLRRTSEQVQRQPRDRLSAETKTIKSKPLRA
jgi:hypothetical protein